MTQQANLLRAHLELLLAEDPNFARLWRESDENRRAQLVNTAITIERACADDLLAERFMIGHDKLKRYLVTVQERQFQYTRIPSDWPLFILHDERRQQLFETARQGLTRFLTDSGLARASRLYGGLKPLSSIDPKRFRAKQESEIQRELADTWDAVRFRIVVDDVSVLRKLSVSLWEVFFDEILRCRNYYFHPKGGSPQHPYRAVHFQLAAEDGYPFELQIMTHNSEVVSHLEHAVIFKRRISAPSERHMQWLEAMRYKVVTLDADRLPSRSTDTPKPSRISRTKSLWRAFQKLCHWKASKVCI
jgi:ppGpp synthetase/RelA/SpoT-type nucleotidyltranferase